MRGGLLSACAALAVVAGGCAPIVAELLAERHYGEALCAVNGYGRGRQHAEVMAALRGALDPAVHVHAVTQEEIAPLVGDKASALGEAVLLVRVRYDTRQVELGSFALHARLVAAEGAADPDEVSVPPAWHPEDSWFDRKAARELIAALTGEELPEGRRYDYGPSAGQRAADGLQISATLSLALLEVATLGILPFREMFGVGMPPSRASGSGRRRPTDAEFRAQAPATEALIDLFRTEAFRRYARPGARYEHLQMWRRPPEDAALELVLSAWYDAPAGDLGVQCDELEVVRVRLPPGDTLEARIRAVFGDRMRRLYELGPPVPRAAP